VAHEGGIDVTANTGGGARFSTWFPDGGPVPDVTDAGEAAS
jgi:hypothetical protein